MNLKQADLGREVVVGKNQLDSKTLQVKASHFNALRILIVAAVCVVVSLMYTVVKLQNESQQQNAETNRLHAQISSLKGQVEESNSQLDAVTAQKDSTNSKALGYIESIQAKLKKINEYMSRRGLKGVSFKPIKKAKDGNAKVSSIKLYSKYNDYLARLVNNIAMIPMGYPRISAFTSYFGYRGNPFDFGRSEFHPGIDFRGQMGDPVKCTASGRVVFTGRAGGYGNCIRIQHAGNLQTWYGHLSHINVREGQKVNVGDVIGRVGSTGRSTGPHLHYEVRKDGHPVNPIQYLTLNS